MSESDIQTKGKGSVEAPIFFVAETWVLLQLEMLRCPYECSEVLYSPFAHCLFDSGVSMFLGRGNPG